jgi:hypothetical protein
MPALWRIRMHPPRGVWDGEVVPLPSVDDSVGLKLLPGPVSMVAGSADAISLLGLGGLFRA